MHGGTEIFSGEDSYSAIAIFKKYWELLTAEQRNKAYVQSDALKNIIENKFYNEKKWQQGPAGERCVNNLAKDLKAILEQKSSFAEISLSKESNDTLIKQYEDQFKTSKEEIAVLETKDSGRDKLYLNANQIHDCVNPNDIKTLDNVMFLLKNLRAEEILNLKAKFGKAIWNTNRDTGILLFVLLELSEEQIEPFGYLFRSSPGKFSELKPEATFAEIFNICGDNIMSKFLKGIGDIMPPNMINLFNCLKTDHQKKILFEHKKSDIPYMFEVVKLCPLILKYVDDLRNNSEFLKIIAKNISSAPNVKQNKGLMLQLVSIHSLSIIYAGEFNKDKDIVRKAVSVNINRLVFADESLKKDEKFLLELMLDNFRILQYADQSLKKDKTFVLTAIKKNHEVFDGLGDISSDLVNDKEYFYYAEKVASFSRLMKNIMTNITPTHHHSDCLKKNWECLSEEWQNAYTSNENITIYEKASNLLDMAKNIVNDNQSWLTARLFKLPPHPFIEKIVECQQLAKALQNITTTYRLTK